MCSRANCLALHSSDQFRVTELTKRNPAVSRSTPSSRPRRSCGVIQVLVCAAADKAKVVRVVARGNWEDFNEDVARRLDMPSAARCLTGAQALCWGGLSDSTRRCQDRSTGDAAQSAIRRAAACCFTICRGPSTSDMGPATFCGEDETIGPFRD